MKVLFLDVDGVLNKNNTKEFTIFGGQSFTSLDGKLVKLFLDWISQTNVKIVLSSDWRRYNHFRDLLMYAGISWVRNTPELGSYIGVRGDEIQTILDEGWIERYAIIDDMGYEQFQKKQRKFLVQTSPLHGIEAKKIKKLNRILNE